MIFVVVLLFPYAVRLFRRFFPPEYIDHFHLDLAVHILRVRNVVEPEEPVAHRAEDALWAEDAEGGGWDEDRWGNLD